MTNAYCPFCEKKQTKLSRHLTESKEHQDNIEVIKYKSTKDKVEKNKILTKIRNLGNYKHNIKVLSENKGILIPVYRPDHDADPQHYLPCQHCLGFYAKEDLWKHSCKLKKESDESTDGEPPTKKRKTHIKVSRCLLPHSKEVEHNEHAKKVLAGLRGGEESRLIKSDSLLLRLLTDKFVSKLGHDVEQYSYIRTKLREIARLLLNYRELSGKRNASLTDMINPQKFQNVIEAAKLTAGFDETTQLYATPTLAVKLGHTLKKASDVLMGESLMNGDQTQADLAKGFNKLHEMKWNEAVTTHAFRTLRENRRNRPKLLPLT